MKTDKDTDFNLKVYTPNCMWLFIRPFVFNGAINILNTVVGLGIPKFTYWQMFVLLIACVRVCKCIGFIFHGGNTIE